MILERHVVSLSSSLKTDKSGLYVLARVCERLIEGKPITAGELWYGDTPELSRCARGGYFRYIRIF